jgi:hypothetical protein
MTLNPSASHFNCSDAAAVINNFFNLSIYACDSSFFNDQHPLPLYVGYLIVVVLGLVFAAGCLAITLYDHWKLGTVETSEVCRIVSSFKPSMTALHLCWTLDQDWSDGDRHRVQVVCSPRTDTASHSRTWAATLLQSANVAYKYGIAGPFWYAAGGQTLPSYASLTCIQPASRSSCSRCLPFK